MRQLTAMMQYATAAHAVDCLTVLHGLYGARGDAEVVSTVGVELIEAEQPCIGALYATTLAMLRPTSGKEATIDSAEIKPEARRFLPTMPEFILELQKQDELWRRREQILLALPEWVERVARQPNMRGLDLDDDIPF